MRPLWYRDILYGCLVTPASQPLRFAAVWAHKGMVCMRGLEGGMYGMLRGGMG